MQVSGATDLASKGQGVSDSSSAKIKGGIDDQFQSDTKVRCFCGSSLASESMIQVYLFDTYSSLLVLGCHLGPVDMQYHLK